MQIIQSRRHFLAGTAAVGAAGFIGTSTEAWAEPPPETTKAVSYTHLTLPTTERV